MGVFVEKNKKLKGDFLNVDEALKVLEINPPLLLEALHNGGTARKLRAQVKFMEKLKEKRELHILKLKEYIKYMKMANVAWDELTELLNHTPGPNSGFYSEELLKERCGHFWLCGNVEFEARAYQALGGNLEKIKQVGEALKTIGDVVNRLIVR